MGVPAIPMCTQAYTELAKLTAARDGMPHLRQVFTPHPVGGKTDAELAAYLVNPDPVSGIQIMKEIVDDLTKPLTADETKTGLQAMAAGPATFGPDTVDNLQEIFMNNGMTDYMPIVIPTEEKVQAMLKATSHKPDEVLRTPIQGVGYTSARWGYTVRQVAVNAVMAGCRPEYFPVVLAMASLGPLGLFGSTTSSGFAIVINGPIRDKLNMNYTLGALSPFAQANATIGRSWTLMGKNLTNGGIPGDTYQGGQGNQLDYNNCVIAEDEKNSPWTPFHVQMGFKPEENVVSIFGGPDVRQGHGAKGAGAEIAMFDQQISFMCQSMVGGSGALAILDPLVAKRLVDQGYDNKEKLSEWVFKNTQRTVKDFKESFLASFHLYPLALQGREPYASWYKLPDDAMIPFFVSAKQINFVVCGGQANAFFQVANMNHGRSASIDKWM
ncbi:MAG TPA: UGSC family (seleno)protein [Candidatus Acidoferrales bacterium]|nr:UGSC family (seleno)protein [Candidatus Acidoferrales bacterium]